ncbi:hypothetical protein [Nocardioides aromaticivorans]|uniref:hypothetical protein n=1 Tax=Nocardioides aromaticivorans TaxID=200618 RepID=UPI001A9032F0|nr:hypothetical protein [Nocardioides aromaticivorans]
MRFDPAQMPGEDVSRWGADCRAKALAALGASDWRGVHEWTKSWIGWGGGAWIPDTWLLYAASALLEGKPRNAVHGLDLGLRVWLAGASDRAALTWLRGLIVMDRLADPKTALIDLEESLELLPNWLRDESADRLERCRDEAARSRKRVPSVQPRPAFVGAEGSRHVVAPSVSDRVDGSEPEAWPVIRSYFRM